MDFFRRLRVSLYKVSDVNHDHQIWITIKPSWMQNLFRCWNFPKCWNGWPVMPIFPLLPSWPAVCGPPPICKKLWPARPPPAKPAVCWAW